MTWKGGTALAIAALAAVAVACGGSSPSTTAESSPSPSPSPVKQAVIAQVDACTLVTAAEATAAAKTNMTNAAASGGYSIPGACVYTSADNGTTVFIFAQFYPDSSSVNNISPDQIAAAMRGQYGITNAKSVTGIGDKAFEYTATAASSGQSGMALIAFKNNVVLMVVLSPSTDSNAIETLAKTAVSRLKAS